MELFSKMKGLSQRNTTWTHSTFQEVVQKTPSFIPGQRCPENFKILIFTDVQFPNFNNSEVVKDIDELLSYSENLVF